MGYDDGFYYGQCKLICLAESAADNGKTVSVSNGDRSWSGTVANQKCEFLVPNRTQYAVELIDGDDTDWTGTIEAGYGECILVHLADGYEAIVEKKKLTLDEIAASVGSVADYVPDADAVKTLNANLGGLVFSSVDGVPYVKVGADSPRPFNSGGILIASDDVYNDAPPTYTYTLEKGTYLVYSHITARQSGTSPINISSSSGSTITSLESSNSVRNGSVIRMQISKVEITNATDTISVSFNSQIGYPERKIMIFKVNNPTIVQKEVGYDVDATKTINYTVAQGGKYLLIAIGSTNNSGSYQNYQINSSDAFIQTISKNLTAVHNNGWYKIACCDASVGNTISIIFPQATGYPIRSYYIIKV